MSRVSNLRQRITVFEPKSIQAGSPHTSAMELNLAQQVSALWYQWIATSRTWQWSNPATAPTAEITAEDTATAFKFQDGTHDDTLHLPYLAQAGFDAIELLVVVAINPSTADFMVRVNSQTLVTAVTTTTSPYVPGLSNKGPPPRGAWREATDDNRFLVPIRILHEDPDIDSSDRMVSLTFDAIWAPVNPDQSDLTVTREVKIFSIHARDVLKDSTD